MPRKSNCRALVPVGTSTTRDVVRKFGRKSVPVEAVYHVVGIKPKGVGPWNGEADKIAWTDRETGYGIIIRRSPTDGHLGGYVGVGPDHPLHGYPAHTLAGFAVHAHGGITYAQPCRKHESETRRVPDPEAMDICHVTRLVTERIVPAGFKQEVHLNEHAHHDNLWWFGFECDTPADVVPGGRTSYQHPVSPAMTGINRRVYRDEAYVHRECIRLARQLKAIADGRNPADVVEAPPSIGYDPGRAM